MNDSQTYYPIDLLKPIANVASNLGLMVHITSDPYTFSSYCAILIKLIDDQKAVSLSKNLQKAREFFEQNHPVQHSKSYGTNAVLKERENALRILNDLKSQLGDKITAGYAQLFFSLNSLYDEVIQTHGQSAGTVALATEFIKPLTEGVQDLINLDFPSTVNRNLDYICKLLKLSKQERALIETTMLATVDPSFTVFTKYFELSINDRADMMHELVITFISGSLDYDDVKLASKALDVETSVPLAFGIVNYDKRFKRLGRLSEFWVTVLMHDDPADSDGLYKLFIREAKHQQSFSGALARIGEQDAEMVHKLVDVAFADSLTGCNVLLYGSRKLDKRSVALSMLEGKADAVYEMNKRKLNHGDYPSACLFAQQYLAKHAATLGKAVLLVENTEDVLSRGARKSAFFINMMGDTQGKNEGETVLDSDEHLLTNNVLPSVWLINSVSELADEAVGRFLLHCEIKGGTRQDRRDEVERIVNELELPADLCLALSKYYELGSHQIRSAARLANVFKLNGEAAQSLILRSVENSQKALGRENVEEIRESVTSYNLNLLNLSGRFKPDEIITALKKKQQGTLCFYGLPGTGKTQLAEYIAMQLDKPLLIKRASDILSMWLGESEQNIRKMFDEARSEGAVLLLDEADSFMRDRSLARASYEVTMVNELLTRMERFNGVFICATNLFEQLDAAALRRFTFKLEFRTLNEQQRIQMFTNETGVTLEHDDPMWFDLISIRFLTPGDFATVKRQSLLLDQVLSPQQWIEQLSIEARAKLAGVSKYAPSNEELLSMPEVTPNNHKGLNE